MVREYSMQTEPAEKAILGGGFSGLGGGPTRQHPPPFERQAQGHARTTRKAFPKEILHRGFMRLSVPRSKVRGHFGMFRTHRQ